MSNAATPAEGAGGNTATSTSGSKLGELPPRVRVHALAKLLGLNSREVLAKLTELGEPARSAQSSVPRETAIRVADALVGQPETESGSQPQPQAEPIARPLVHAPVFAAPSPLFLPPEPQPVRPAPVADPPAASEPDGPETEPAEDDESGGRRRRRRGRRGRGRGKGSDEATAEEQSEDSAKTDEEEQAEAEAETSDETDETDDAESSSSSRRRRRRRRRKSADDDVTESSDDPPNTVVHVREAKVEPEKKDSSSKESKDSKSDGVRSVRGSTRLEAKRQRRRDGREAGRRRAPILSEAEFLARRESVERTMVVAERGDNTQIGVLEDGVLVEHFVTSSGSGSIVGNVYLGRVQNVLPSMEAAFVDIGRGRNAVLYAGEVDWDAAGLEGKSRKIEQALSTGDNVLVQVTKDPVGHKGARLTTQISLPGRFLVYVPAGGATGISRKLPENERRRLKDILKRIVPEDAGVIIRTASEGISEEELERDVRRLKAQWEIIKEKTGAASGKKAGAPTMLYEEPDLLVKVVRDLFTEDFSKLEVQGGTAWETINAYVQHVAPDLTGRLKRYVGTGDVFADYRIDEQIIKALDRKVWLPSGGYLVIDRTEAMTVIDVNTGKFTGSGGNLEETVTRNNLESAEEIVRQLRLRDIGGIIVIDFIDMVLESNRELVLRRLTECLGRDRTRHQVAEVTSLGLVQMTRKKVGTGLLEAFSTTCEHCKGRGVIISTEPQRSNGGNGNGNGSNGGGHTHSPRRARGRGKVEEQPPAETRAEPAGPTPEQRESVVSAVQAMANAAKLVSSGKEHSKDDEPAEVEATITAEPVEETEAAEPAATQDTRDVDTERVDAETTPSSKARRAGRASAPAGTPESVGSAESSEAERSGMAALNGRISEPPAPASLPEPAPESEAAETAGVGPAAVEKTEGSGDSAEVAEAAEPPVAEPYRWWADSRATTETRAHPPTETEVGTQPEAAESRGDTPSPVHSQAETPRETVAETWAPTRGYARTEADTETPTAATVAGTSSAPAAEPAGETAGEPTAQSASATEADGTSTEPETAGSAAGTPAAEGPSAESAGAEATVEAVAATEAAITGGVAAEDVATESTASEAAVAEVAATDAAVTQEVAPTEAAAVGAEAQPAVGTEEATAAGVPGAREAAVSGGFEVGAEPETSPESGRSVELETGAEAVSASWAGTTAEPEAPAEPVAADWAGRATEPVVSAVPDATGEPGVTAAEDGTGEPPAPGELEVTDQLGVTVEAEVTPEPSTWAWKAPGRPEASADASSATEPGRFAESGAPAEPADSLAPVEPEASVEPETSVGSGTLGKSESFAGREAITEPETATQPEASAQPEGFTEPEAPGGAVLAEPGTTAETSATVESVHAEAEPGGTEVEHGRGQAEPGGSGVEPGGTEVESGRSQAEPGVTEVESGDTGAESGGAEAEAGGAESGMPDSAVRSARRRPRRVVSRPAGPPVHASDQS